MLDNLIWSSIGLLTFIVVVALAQIMPVVTEYDSDGRALVRLCRAIMKRLNPVVWLVLACVLGPFAPFLLLGFAVAFDREVK